MKLSAIIIARNEEKNIVECIKSLSFADEILLIDNKSTDKTAQRAKALGAIIYTVEGLDFSYIRNIGKEKAKGAWLLYIDADERVTVQLKQEIEGVIKVARYEAYEVARQNYYLDHLWPKQELMIRLVKKKSLIGWQGSLHETPLIVGTVGILSGSLLHYTHSDLSHMVEKTNEWSEIEAQLRYKSGHPQIAAWRIFRVMITTFCRYYIVNSGWKVGTVGLIESIYQAFSIFVTYAKLWELQNKNNLKPNRN